MQIAVNTRFLLPEKMEGIGWFTYEIVKRLVEAHPEDTFHFLFDRPYDERFLFGENVVPHVVFPPARHPFLWYWWFEWSLPPVLKKTGADIFFSPDGYCSLRSDIPTVMVTHDIAHVHYPDQIPWLVRQYYQYFVPRYLKRAEQIVTVSAFTREDIMLHYGIPDSHITVGCNGCRAEFQPLSPEAADEVRQQYAGGKPYFFYLGAVHPRKNVDRLIQAFDQFKEQSGAPMKLLIGGRLAWQTSSVRRLYEEATYKEDIIFLGYIDQDQLPRIMGGALALTYVSLFEGFGLPVLEAMHCDVPVITSRVSSLPEVAGKAALLADPKSVDNISKAMMRIWREPQLRQKLIASGREQCQVFTWDRAAETVYNAIRSVRIGE